MTQETEYDVVVLGSGAAGMTLAAVAANEGLKVIVLEKTDLIGGNTSFSGGMIYIPNNNKMADLGVSDSAEDMMTYFDSVIPVTDGRDMRESFVRNGREAIRYLEANTAIDLRPVPFYPDYYPELEGAREGARCLEPNPFDASCLGAWFKKLRPPIPEFTILGGMMIGREDLPHFRNVFRSPRSTLRVARLVGQHLLQRLRHHRGTRLVLGNALAGQLLKSLVDCGVDIQTNVETREIIKQDGRVVGVRANTPDGERHFRARIGVVLATGGFAQNKDKRRQYLPEVTSSHSPYAPGSTGDGLDLGTGVGGVIRDDNTNNAYWSPASVYRRADGRTVVFPHTVTDRGKPGSVVVNKAGKRFVDESVSYHRFGEALAAHNEGRDCLPAWIIADSPFIWKYGLGAIVPFTRNLKPYQQAGYLTSAETLPELADKLGIDKQGLAATMERFNSDARRGQDSEFGRGGNVYSRYLGDGAHKPNPCLGPLETGPFHAIELVLSDLGTVAGLDVDGNCQVRAADGSPVTGLYAIGNDMHSIMRGRYPGPGTTLGPALTFGYLLARHLSAGKA